MFKHISSSLRICYFFFTVFLFSAVVANAQDPLLSHNFETGTLAELGWTVSPVANFNQGFVTLGTHPEAPVPNFNAGTRALVMRAAPGEGNILFGPVLQTGNEPALLRMWMNVSNEGGNVAFGALNVPDGQNLASTDGSAGYSVKVNTSEYVDTYEITLAIMRPQGEALAPIIQMVVPETNAQPVTLTIDNVQVYSLNSQLVNNSVLQNLLGLDASVFPTPTPIGVNPTPSPTITPPPNIDNIFINDVFTISPTDDQNDAFSPEVVHDQNNEYALVSNVMSEGTFIDVGLRTQDIVQGTVTDPIIVNQTFEETETRQPDLDVDFAGNRHVVWSDNRSVEKLYSIYYAPVGVSGNKLVEEDLTVNRLFEDTNAANPAIATQNDSEFIIVWQDDRNFLNDIFGRRLAWDGNNIVQLDETDFRINIPFGSVEDDIIIHAKTPDVSITPSGNILTVWADDRVQQGNEFRNDIYGRFFQLDTPITEDGALPENNVPELSITEFSDTLLDQATLPKVAFSNGYFVVVWQSEIPSAEVTEIRGAVIDEQGQIIQEEFVIAGQQDGITLTNPSISAFPNDSGLFFVSWFDQEKNEVFGTVYDPANHSYIVEPVGLVNQVFDLRQTTVSVGDNNRFLLGWDGSIEQFIEIFTAPGEVAQSAGLTAKPIKPVSRKGFSTNAQSIFKSATRGTSNNKVEREDQNNSPKR